MSANTGSSVTPRRTSALRVSLFVLLVVALVSLPFALFGEEFALPLLEARSQQSVALVLIAIALLTADSVAPVPSVVVIIFLAAKAGWLAGVIGGTIGLTGQVLCAAIFGRVAVGRLAPRFFPDTELARLRQSLQQRLGLTLACFRSVPVLAETSVMIAASLGLPLRRIVMVTVLPNLAISAIYSLAIDASFATACLAFFATVVPSYALWRWSSRRPSPAG